MLLPQERIPWILRFSAFRRNVKFRLDHGKPFVYLTFDDGPIPESTPWLLQTLAEYGAKATFFMVADNARRYPDLFKAVMDAGHAIGNHTFHHRPPFRQTTKKMMDDVRLADETLGEIGELWEGGFPTAPRVKLFRPPHGLIFWSQQKALSEAGYTIVMFDLNTLDYRADRTPQQILDSVVRNVRPGCIINFHDSLKSIGKLKQCLPQILSHLLSQGYSLPPMESRPSGLRPMEGRLPSLPPESNLKIK